ncbi:uncharacterized protein A1O9_02856 [Exophiala aquamarina CBS 119918]|uniref:Major facilitator superfamily (MFS) profile domain-containing protein n=1 Tax=Exophiala aquamarina CBS 119918 TaxID=1182545 RepID=A0A072PN64_9EURO|nr:uncharacterized protein A1O9_02856 [Exophiala aquamarina CBS 119918]KEF61291.1 hypothetical protein A1O9_02856 [Exophiala aquamarina CBS 119918]
MGIDEESPIVGVVVSVYYLGCAVGVVLASKFADAKRRRPGIFACLATASVGDLLMLISGFGNMGHNPSVALAIMLVARVVMGLGVGEDPPLGWNSLLQHFACRINWAWRPPIIIMQIYPALLFTGANLLPETPRWLVLNGEEDRAKKSIARVFGEDAVEDRIQGLLEAHKQEEGMDRTRDFQVYGPQIFELLGFGVTEAEYITLGNYLFYFATMTLAWILIDRVGRRRLMVEGALWLCISFALLTLLGGLAYNGEQLSMPLLATGTPGITVLYLATSVFGIGWLVPPWLIPTKIFPSTARAQGAAISVVVWGIANFAVTLLTPIGFNSLGYFLLLVFAITNAIAGILTYLLCPESARRTFEENQDFFKRAAGQGTWLVARVAEGEFKDLPGGEGDDGEVEEGGEPGQRQQGSRSNRSSAAQRRDKKIDAANSETSPLPRDRVTDSSVLTEIPTVNSCMHDWNGGRCYKQPRERYA